MNEIIETALTSRMNAMTDWWKKVPIICRVSLTIRSMKIEQNSVFTTESVQIIEEIVKLITLIAGPKKY